MNMMLECEATLSKKLEHLCDKGEGISLHITGITGNKGRALIRLASTNADALKEAMAVGETSLMLKVIMVDEDIPSPGDNVIGNMFGGGSLVGSGSVENLVGQVDPDQPMRASKPSSIKTQDNRQIEHRGQDTSKAPPRPAPQVQVFSVSKEMEASRAATMAPRSVMSVEALDTALNNVQNIDKDIQVNLAPGAKLPRGDAIKMEMSVPRMKDKCFIKNNLKSLLLIDDIEVTSGQALAILPGQVVEISRFPAKKIRDSSNLRWCLEKDYVKFVSYEEYVETFKRLAQMKSRADQSPLKVYGSRDEALGDVKSAMATSDEHHAPATEIAMNDEKPVPYEDDQYMDNLVGAMPR